MKLSKVLAGLATAAVIGASAASATACGSASPDTYAPAAYGVPGHCYYVQDPAEALALEAAGLCPQGWVPTLAPLYWQETYYSYYSSPAYVNVYVPARVRTVYVQRETSFGRTYRAAIATRSRTASYRSSSGKVVKGSTLTGKARFGSGSAGTSHGGGSLRNGSTGLPSPQPRYTSGTPRSGFMSGGSSRSGSLRSGRH